MKNIVFGALLLLSLSACKTLEPAYLTDWSGAMTKGQLAAEIPGKTFTLLDVGSGRGNGKTVTLRFDADNNVDGSSTSGLNNSGTWGLKDYEQSGLVCMEWKKDVWPDWCLKMVKDQEGMKFNEISDFTKFLIQAVEQESTL